jgi:surface antigen
MKLGKLLLATAVTIGLLGTGASQSRADNELLGGLLGGAAGAGLGAAFGGAKGAAIGGVAGLALGALSANQFSRSERRREQSYAAPPPQYSQGYAPPPQYGYQPAAPQAYAAPSYPAPRPTTAYGTSYCREYSSTTVIDGVSRVTHGTACRQADGTWRIVN